MLLLSYFHIGHVMCIQECTIHNFLNTHSAIASFYFCFPSVTSACPLPTLGRGLVWNVKAAFHFPSFIFWYINDLVSSNFDWAQTANINLSIRIQTGRHSHVTTKSESLTGLSSAFSDLAVKSSKTCHARSVITSFVHIESSSKFKNLRSRSRVTMRVLDVEAWKEGLRAFP